MLELLSVVAICAVKKNIDRRERPQRSETKSGHRAPILFMLRILLRAKLVLYGMGRCGHRLLQCHAEDDLFSQLTVDNGRLSIMSPRNIFVTNTYLYRRGSSVRDMR